MRTKRDRFLRGFYFSDIKGKKKKFKNSKNDRLVLSLRSDLTAPLKRRTVDRKGTRMHTYARAIFFFFFHSEAILILSFELRPSGDPQRAFPSHNAHRRIRSNNRVRIFDRIDPIFLFTYSNVSAS